jgi:hypothetical protein
MTFIAVVRKWAAALNAQIFSLNLKGNNLWQYNSIGFTVFFFVQFFLGQLTHCVINKILI